MFSAHNLSLAFLDRKILDHVSLTLLPGERLALVGQNGAGKSTLLKALAEGGQDDGVIECSSLIKIGFLQQTPQLDEQKSVIDSMRDAMKDHRDLIIRHQKLCEELALSAHSKKSQKIEEEISALESSIEHKGGFDIDFLLEKVLNKLGIKAREQKIATLSGGEKRRVDVARILLMAPDIYLLDEPTNHLDFNAIAFLVETFKKSKAALLFVSHDTAFIDALATKIVELSKAKLYSHEPPYVNYLENKLVRELIDERSLHRRERLVVNELAWLRAGTPARTTKQNARIDRAYALIDSVVEDTRLTRTRKLEIEKTAARRLGSTILELENIGFSFKDKELFKDINLKVGAHQRYGIVGPNGAGKTTLLKIIAQQIAPSSGTVKLGKNTKILEFDQNRAGLDLNKTLKETLADHGDFVFIGDKRIHIASYLEKYLFDPSDAMRKVSTLSGGEQNRLLLAKLLRSDANCFLLDEPTNDLDVTSLAILEEMLLDYDGVVFTVSHDRNFLDKICTHIIAFDEAPVDFGACHDVQVYTGNYQSYVGQKASVIKDAVNKESKKNVVRKREKTRRSYKEELEYQAIEGIIEGLELERSKLHEELASPDHFRASHEIVQEKMARLSELEKEIERLYERWQDLSSFDG